MLRANTLQFCQVNIEDKSDELDVLAAFSEDSIDNEPPSIPGTVIKKKDPRVPTFGERIIINREASGTFYI